MKGLLSEPRFLSRFVVVSKFVLNQTPIAHADLDNTMSISAIFLNHVSHPFLPSRFMENRNEYLSLCNCEDSSIYVEHPIATIVKLSTDRRNLLSPFFPNLYLSFAFLFL